MKSNCNLLKIINISLYINNHTNEINKSSRNTYYDLWVREKIIRRTIHLVKSRTLTTTKSHLTLKAPPPYVFLLLVTGYTGIASIFEESSHLITIPSRCAGRTHFDHRQPVGTGSGGGTIINTLSFR